MHLQSYFRIHSVGTELVNSMKQSVSESIAALKLKSFH